METHQTRRAAAISARLDAMRDRHRALDAQVARQHRRPLPDATLLQRLKRRKQRLKDELARYEGLLRTLAHGHATA